MYFKRQLCSIPVMDIPIDDSDSLTCHGIALLQMLSCDGDIVEEAEPHGLFPLCMMSWWADTGEPVFELAFGDLRKFKTSKPLERGSYLTC